MPAAVDLIWFKTATGNPFVTPINVVREEQGYGFGFFGADGVAVPQTYGYMSDPTEVNAALYPVAPGHASWQVWLSPRFSGTGFQLITSIRFYMASRSGAAGLGTLAGTGGEDYLVPTTAAPITKTGVHLRELSGPIERGIDPLPYSAYIPASAPGYGLPSEPDTGWAGWLLYGVGPGDFRELADADEDDPPQVLDLTPVNPLIGGGGTGIVSANPEPRFANLCVATMVVADDGSLGFTEPAVFGLTWDES